MLTSHGYLRLILPTFPALSAVIGIDGKRSSTYKAGRWARRGVHLPALSRKRVSRLNAGFGSAGARGLWRL